ncbi:hypothetical protein QBC34DRAFT_381458 [Podospora aff. communis PSN243]|uniref:Uncharacterized protein n=1 Tax=Podospora aff. communis PSN243 TaxID=3040156 RepID=A0AAV9GLN9_9PEZI|nr:hypothetical protein QBC34DRAFT_381458 [Podospora aff. communis PSN243]
MDPEFHHARERFTRRKHREKPSSKKCDFRKALERNPYAQALATPARLCGATKALMPKFFLQQFRLVTHPETDETWWMAQNLKKKEPPRSSSASTRLAAGKTAREPTGPSAYTLSRHDLLDALIPKRSPYANKQKSLMHQSITPSNSSISEYLNKAVWRHDMGPLLLEIMRRRVVEQLLYFADKVENADRRYLIRCESWDEVKQYNHRGCMLYFGGPIGTDTTVIPQLSTMSIKKRYNGTLAVHNMQDLLTEEHIQHLRTESPVLRDGSLFLLGRRPTLDLQLLLWKLQGYVSSNSAPVEEDHRNNDNVQQHGSRHLDCS